jgi:hypothetical protein
MVTSKQLNLVAATVLATGLFSAHPARALTVIAQSHAISFDQGRIDAVQPIGHRRWYGYRGGWHDYRRGWRGYYSPWPRYAYHSPWPKYSALPYWRRFPGLPYEPWGPYEPCVNCPAFK